MRKCGLLLSAVALNCQNYFFENNFSMLCFYLKEKMCKAHTRKF